MQNLTNLNILFKFYKNCWVSYGEYPVPRGGRGSEKPCRATGKDYPVPGTRYLDTRYRYLMTRRGTGYLALRSGKIELSIRK